MRMKPLRFPLAILVEALLVAAPLRAATYTIDPSRITTEWSAAGVPGGFQQYRPGGANARSNFAHDVIYYGADPTGTNDCSIAFRAARNACAGTNQVMVIPAGTYKLADQVDLYGNMTWRGAGVGQTTIMLYDGGRFYSDGDSPVPTPTVTVTAGATRGSTVLTVDNASTVVPGKLVSLTVLNPSYVHMQLAYYGGGPSDDGHDATRLMSITFRVVSKDNGAKTVTLDHALPIDMTGTPMLTVWSGYCLRQVGFEDMTVDASNNVSSWGQMFLLDQTDSCWFYNVNFHHLYRRSVWFQKSVNCTVEHCDADSTRAPGAGANSEGLDFYHSDCWNLVQNCAFDNAGYPMIILGDFGGGCVGNVIAYNYARNETGATSAPMAVSGNHGPHNMFNLWEGNYAQNYASDGYFGSDSHNTLARNYFSGQYDRAIYDDECAIVLAHWATTYNIVGNVLGTGGGYSTIYKASGTSYQNGVIFRLGYPNEGNRSGWSTQESNPTDPTHFDTNVEASAIIHANYDFVNNAQTFISTDHDIPSSYYLSSKPAWFGNLTWPAFDPSNPGTPTPAQIPAGYRFTNGVEPPGVGTTQPPANAKTQIQAR